MVESTPAFAAALKSPMAMLAVPQCSVGCLSWDPYLYYNLAKMQIPQNHDITLPISPGLFGEFFLL